jgi:hypothetical protein
LSAERPLSTPEEETDIVGFVRTPEGNGVAVLRPSGGDVWKLDQNTGCLNKAGSWLMGDLVVVLDQGMSNFFLRDVQYS